ncbi:LPS export ABC transporter periplasmic protein LptC [Halanaerobium praevalens]|uniref:OstA family protein n=1 Tax=Halanaerobium praevalens (strain ATCC 33744 / DSM 2228 / GSL) TaxID=572479 RepID=E3DRC0_HALPG|nr:LPS export ABC transporter periplasmic protein LptC [Halanaerobium praevalens]ADO78052.1 hypothetical protein Hprae_1927 [Halanaerobium praevalens DSM 2228]
MLNKRERKINEKLIIIFAISILLFSSLPVLAAVENLTDNYLLEADNITFLKQKNLLLFTGNASFKSVDFEIKAERFKVDTAAKTVETEAQVVIYSDKDNVQGSGLFYNYETEKGKIYEADGSLGKLNFSGEILKIISVNPLKAEMDSARFTPCSRKDPHYHYWAKEVEINDDNTMDIYHLVPFVGKIPVFYLPYYSVTYDPNDEDSLKSTYPMPRVGYDNDRGVTVEFNYPYQISERNWGEINYLTEGREDDRYETRRFTNYHQLSKSWLFKNRYQYLYNYDLDDEELDDFDEEFFSSLVFNRGKYALEAGIGKDLQAEDDDQDRYLLSGRYRFDNGLRTNFKHEYNFDWEQVKEKYTMSYSKHSINWNLKYVDGESYNYYPYLTLAFPSVLGVRTTIGSGRVENKGTELNKERINFRYNFRQPLPAGFSYHLAYNYRLDHYRSGYDYNYHYTTLNTGFKHQLRFNKKYRLNSSLFFQKNYPWGQSPLVDDREDQDRLIKPALTLNVNRKFKDSSLRIKTSAIYDLDLEDWDEINLRFTQQEDCYSLFLNYEFKDESISFGIEI